MANINTAAKSTFLELVQSACNEIGATPPSLVIGANDDQTRQLLALANREANEFSKMANGYGGWQELYKEYSFLTSAVTGLTGDITSGSAIITGISSTSGLAADIWGVQATGLPNAAQIVSVDSSTQITLDRPATASTTGATLTIGKIGYAMPSDFEYFIQQTFWDGSYRWQLLGPLDAQEKDVLKYGISPVGPRRRFWIRNNYMYLQPQPTNSTDVIAFDYFSNAWCQSQAGAAQNVWTADTDYYVLDDDCFVLGLKWRFLRAKGLDYGEERMAYDAACQRQLARNSGNRALPLNAMSTNLRLLNNNNIPDTGFGT